MFIHVYPCLSMFILLTLNLSHSLQSFIVTWRLPTRMSQPSVGLSSVSPGESHSHGKFPWSSKRGHRLDCLWSGRKLVWLPRWLSNIPRFDKSVNTIMSWPTWMVYMFYNGTHIYIYEHSNLDGLYGLYWFIWNGLSMGWPSESGSERVFSYCPWCSYNLW